MRSCVVIPTYNEIENIEEVITRVLKNDVDVLIVDDSSPDGTADMVRELAEQNKGRILLEVRAQKQGLGKAYVFGFGKCIDAGYDIICQMDADLSHDPDVLDDLIAPVKADQADLVIGSRYVKGGSIPKWTLLRRLLSRGGNLYTRMMLGIKTHDATAGYRAYRASTLKEVLNQGIQTDGYGFQIEMTYRTTRTGARIHEYPISFADRERGTSKMGGFIIVEALWRVTTWSLRDRIYKPLARLFQHKTKKTSSKDSVEINRDIDDNKTDENISSNMK